MAKDIARSKSKCKGSRLGCGSVSLERRDDLFQKLVVEIIGRPSRHLVRLNILAELEGRVSRAMRRVFGLIEADLH